MRRPSRSAYLRVFRQQRRAKDRLVADMACGIDQRLPERIRCALTPTALALTSAAWALAPTALAPALSLAREDGSADEQRGHGDSGQPVDET